MFELTGSEWGVGDMVEYERVDESFDGSSHVALFEASVAPGNAAEDVCDLIYLFGEGGDGDIACTVVLDGEA